MKSSVFGLGVVLPICLWLIMGAGQTTQAAEPGVLVQEVTVAPFAIIPVPLTGAPEREDQESLLRRLAEEATARAARTLRKQGRDGGAQRVSEKHPGVNCVVSGTVRLPISLRPVDGGGRAMFHRGPFATANVVLRQADGTVLARREVTLNWGDVAWVQGARHRRARPLDSVLVDFVRKAVDHAVKRLGKD